MYGINYLIVGMATMFMKTSCYNIAVTPSTIKSVFPKAEQEIMEENPTFFGYDVIIDKIQSPDSRLNSIPKFDLIVGAPKTVDPLNQTMQEQPPTPATKGNVLLCTASFASNSPQPNCSTTQREFESERGDAYGMTIAHPKGRNSSLTACSPTKTQYCVTNSFPRYNSPGYCYQTYNLGRSWSPDPKTTDLACDQFNLDLIFVIDGSGSVGEDFKNAIDWVKQVSSDFAIIDGSTRIGVIQYSHYDPGYSWDLQRNVVTEIKLGSIRNHRDLEIKLDSIKLQGYTTYTAAALELAAIEFSNSSRFHWANTSKVLVLLTDGNSTDVTKLPASAQHVRSLNVTTFAIGVGDIVESQLRTIATGNESSSDRVYSIKNYDGLAGITRSLQRAITGFALEGTSAKGDKKSEYKLQMAEYGFSIKPSKLKTSGKKLRNGNCCPNCQWNDHIGRALKYERVNHFRKLLAFTGMSHISTSLSYADIRTWINLQLIYRPRPNFKRLGCKA